MQANAKNKVMREPGRRASTPLTRGRILDAAFEQIEAEGLAQLSTRKLAERLGCQAMSIYHHYPSKHHLLDAMVDHVIGSIEIPPAGGDPLDRLRRAMHAYRAAAMRHPALYPLVAVHRLNTPTGVQMIETYLGLVHDVVGDEELAARHFRTAGYYLTGACLDETAGYAKGPSAADPVDDAYVARECPRLAAAARYFQRQHWAATFELGVEALLAGIKRDARPMRTRRA